MKITEDTLPMAVALYQTRSDIPMYPLDEISTWHFVSGSGKRAPTKTARCSFFEAVAAFLLGEISDYFGDWVSDSLEQVANCNNGKVVKDHTPSIIKTRLINVMSRAELDKTIETYGIDTVGYNKGTP